MKSVTVQNIFFLFLISATHVFSYSAALIPSLYFLDFCSSQVSSLTLSPLRDLDSELSHHSSARQLPYFITQLSQTSGL